MAFSIVLAPEAADDLRRLKADARATCATRSTSICGTSRCARADAHEPMRTSRSRIKRLRGMRRPQFRLRIGEVRVFYDMDRSTETVEILAIVAKSEAGQWLAEFGETG